MINGLMGEGFDQVVHGPVKSAPNCLSLLNSSGIPRVTENILICSARAHGHHMSKSQDKVLFRPGRDY